MAAPPVSLDSREFLMSCLRAALEDPELVDAVAEQAIEAGLNAVAIGGGLVSRDGLKERLFLTTEEAQAVLNICATMAGPGGKPSAQDDRSGPVSVRLLATSSGRLALRLKERRQPAADVPPHSPSPAVMLMEVSPPALRAVEEAPAAPVAVEAVTAAPEPEPLSVADMMECVIAQDGAVVVSRTSLVSDKADKLKPAPTAAAAASHARPASAPVKSTGTTPNTKAPAHSPSSKASPVSAGRPKSAPAAKPSPLALPLDGSSPASASASPASVPSYLRPTAAHKNRTSNAIEPPLSPSLASVPEDPAAERQQRRRKNLFARMASTLLAPTQAFVARVTGRSEEAKAKKDVPVTKASQQLDAVLCSPQGQRVTRPQPFALRAEMRPKSCVLGKEDMDMIEARENAFKRNPVPKHVHESRPIDPVKRSEPKDPASIFEPFQLASLGLHNKKLEELRKKHEEEEARDGEARRFKARSFDQRIATSPIAPPKPPVSPVTKGSAPTFASDARIAHYHTVVEPAKRARMSEAERAKLEETERRTAEEDRRAKEAEDEAAEQERRMKEMEHVSVAELRKSLVFKARAMPDFSAPFRPDPALAKPITSAAEPQLHTVRRLGAAASPGSRTDREGNGLGNGVYDGSGYVDPFFASLRKSTSVLMSSGSPASRGPMGPAAMRRSMAVRQSAAATVGRSPSGAAGPNMANGGLRVSVGSALQAAIRAAARDAARDLAMRDAAASPTCGSRRSTVGPMAASMGSPVAAN